MAGCQALFSPFWIGPLKLKNRLISLPVFTGYAYPDGKVSALMIEHYTRLADTGVAMVVVANAAVTSDGVISTHNLRVDRDEFIPGLAQLAGAIKGKGALACLQLNHGGRFAKTNQPLLPSPIDGSNLAYNVSSLKNFMNFFPFEKRFSLTRYILKLFGTWRRSLTEEDRERVILGFGDAATRAYEAGFDMIELHGANGYLLCQFLSAFTNKNHSKAGEDSERRNAFPLAVFKKVKARLPKEFPVGFRLLLREWVPEGIDIHEALSWAKLLEAEGVAYLSPSVGTYNSMFRSDVLKRMSKPAYLREDLKKFTKAVNVPTIISGRVLKPSLASKLINQGVADLIGLGRPIRVDMDWIKKAETNREKDIKRCINCNWCLKGVILGLGFNCRRWSTLFQERTNLERKALVRMYKGLLVLSNKKDLSILKTSLPALIPEKRAIPTAIDPTVLFLQGDKKVDFPQPVQDEFIHWSRNMLRRLGFKQVNIKTSLKIMSETPDKDVHDAIEQGQHGVIILVHNKTQVWRERLLYKERGKVVALIGTSNRQNEILIPVDLSSTTLLVLRFVCHAFVGKPDLNLNFVHIITGSPDAARQRWEDLKNIVGWDKDFPLQLIPSKGDVASQLLDMVKKDKFGTIIMGKRGFTGMKRWLLGSVSAGVLRGLTDESLFLID